MEFLRKNTRYLIIIVGLMMMVLLIRNFNSRMADLRLLSVEREHVSAQITSLVATKVSLQQEIEYAKSDDAIGAWAYEQGKMAKPGDVVIVPIPADANGDTSVPLPETEPEVVHNWQLWLAMFVD